MPIFKLIHPLASSVIKTVAYELAMNRDYLWEGIPGYIVSEGTVDYEVIADIIIERNILTHKTLAIILLQVIGIGDLGSIKTGNALSYLRKGLGVLRKEINERLDKDRSIIDEIIIKQVSPIE
jgi:hypothetical protein